MTNPGPRHSPTLTAVGDLAALLQDVASGRRGVQEALRAIEARTAPPLQLDEERAARCGFPEVVWGSHKTHDEIVCAARAIFERNERLLVTRLTPEGARAVQEVIPEARYHERARCLTALRTPLTFSGLVAVVCAGTSDLPVAEEARVTAEIAGCATECHYDVGVAGVHRVLAVREQLEKARAVIVVAGMEGALPSVVGGLLSRPVIAVPTSVGYGASLGGLAALLGMLSSCAAGLAVVNIDNGFGAGMLAARISRLH